MSKTAITTSVPPKVVPAPVEPPRPLPHVRRQGLVFQLLAPLASLRITVVLFALSLVLVFLGTVAQMNFGVLTVVKDYFRSWGIVLIPFQLFVQIGQVFFDVPETWYIPGRFPFPGGWLLGTLMAVNLTAAYVVRFRYTWKRLGILGLHAGILTLMAGELINGCWAVEGNMIIETGGSSSYLVHQGDPELAVVSRAEAKEDEVTAVPGSYLRRGGLIENDLLPFDVQVDRYMVNSALVRAKAGDPANPATRGAGLAEVAHERSEVAGTKADKGTDVASAYVTFRRKGSGQSLGTYLVSVWLDRPQKVNVAGKTYEVALRWKRSYQPYTLTLEKFNYEKYPGTNIPKDFSSYIRFVDPTRGEDREVRIWMNHPLRYVGQTFYQSGVLGGEDGTPVRGTILQVVRNPAWLLPYLGCLLVACGMLFHFCVMLAGFLGAKRPQRKAAGPAGPADAKAWAIPAAVLGLAGLYLAFMALTPPAREGNLDLQAAAQLPVQDGGRIKPLDSLARIDLMLISGEQETKDENGTKVPALRWLFDVMTSRLSEVSAARAESYKVFRIQNLEVLNLLGLKARHGFRYAVSELTAEKIAVLDKEADRAQAIEEGSRDVYDNKVLELREHLGLYVGLARLGVRIAPPPEGGRDWGTFLTAAIHKAQADAAANPAAARGVREVVLGYAEGDMQRLADLPLDGPARDFRAVLLAYARGDPQQFNDAAADYQRTVDSDLPPSVANHTRLEVFFNQFAPFAQCCGLYIVALVLACLSWLVYREPLRRAAFWLAVLTLVVHTCALLARMYLMDRWGVVVTNLYSAAVFIGWGCVVLGLVLEVVFPIGIGTAVGAAVGFLAVFVSHHLAVMGDSLEMMRAVLDTNFWLATHVTCVTLGYTATLLAAGIGIVYLGVRGVARLVDPRLHTLQIDLGRGLRMDLFKVISQMLYGIICFAMLFSFVGTVLGGIWADQSWGRFWGWDPKENGALLIVIWNALILHARWGGIVKQAGVARLSVVGAMITIWSFFGTNQLGVGLHAYGFNRDLALVCRWTWVGLVALLAVEALTLLPWQSWFQGPKPKPAA